MTFRHLKIFIAVAQTGSMSAAARELYIAQPTVSQVIAEIENEYGIRLFERLSRRLYITREGRQLLDYARHITALFEEMERDLHYASRNRTLRVGATITVGSCVLPALVARFEAENPSDTVEVLVDNTRVIEEKILSGETIPVATRGEIGVLHHGLKQSKLEYIHHLTTTIDSDLSGLRVLVDCANGAASATAPELFGRFKCYADFIHREPNGTNINDRCGSTHLESLGQRVVAGKYDVGVAFDGDADRCLMVDELGHEIDGDKIMAVCGAYMKRNGRLTGNTIVATVMSNLGLHEFCRKNGIDLVCTNVGDRNVLEKMVECGYKLGGEQSGHMIFTDYATTGDGQLSALQFLQILALSGKSASVLTADCPQYPQVLLNVVVSHDRGVKEAIMASDALKTAVADEEKFLRGEGRILVRPSGTEALIRVMVEAKTESVAQLVAERLVKVIRSV